MEWDKHHNGSLVSEEVSPGVMTEDKKLLGHCIPGCVDYEFDHSFWVATMVTEWDLVCENTWLKTLAKMLLFTGFALGSFCSGLVSDRSVLSRIFQTICVVTNSITLPNTKYIPRYGRRVAIWASSVTMVVFGLITSFIPWYPVFVFTWWVTGTMAIACYTAAFVWTMEIAAGKWKIYLGMSMNYSWPTCRLIIAGARDKILCLIF